MKESFPRFRLLNKSTKVNCLCFSEICNNSQASSRNRIEPHELSRVSLRDIDLERGLLNVQGHKGRNSRENFLKNCYTEDIEVVDTSTGTLAAKDNWVTEISILMLDLVIK